MNKPLVDGIQRAIFGPVSQDEVDAWLTRHVRRRLSAEVKAIVFRSGRLAAVYGVRLSDSVDVVIKVHRVPVDIDRLTSATACQQFLVDHGYPCPTPLDGPSITDGHLAVIESCLDRGTRGDAHQTPIRRAMARALAEQVELLQSYAQVWPSLITPPAWAAYEAGPWPAPHDPIFNFDVTPVGYEWLDHLAQLASVELGPRGAPDAVGHADWVCQNMRFSDGRVSAAYDWDSLLAHHEPVLAGVCAGAYTEGSTRGSVAPAPDEVAAFLTEYTAARRTHFSRSQRRAAVAAATWVLAYNARCVASLPALGIAPPEGSALSMLALHGRAYLDVNW